MDFNDTPEEARFREEASSWLAENAPTDDAFRALSPLEQAKVCLLYTSPSPRDYAASRMPSSA